MLLRILLSRLISSQVDSTFQTKLGATYSPQSLDCHLEDYVPIIIFFNAALSAGCATNHPRIFLFGYFCLQHLWDTLSASHCQIVWWLQMLTLGEDLTSDAPSDSLSVMTRVFKSDVQYSKQCQSCSEFWQPLKTGRLLVPLALLGSKFND